MCAVANQVHHAEPLLEAEGGEGLAEVREGEDTQGQDRHNTRELHGGSQVQGDAS